MGNNDEEITARVEKLLGMKTEAVGANFNIKLNFAQRRLAPAAAGIGLYVGGKAVGKKITDSESAGFGTKIVAAGAAIGGSHAARQAMYMKKAGDEGLTPHMIVAITKTGVFLLDYENGKGPSKILMEFERGPDLSIKHHGRGLRFHDFEIQEDETEAKIECKLGPMQAHHKMNGDCVDMLKEIANK
mmetsp:Transcript_4343/g.4913  ORF Transcript_4343/g.4913 Transcript_4343/m.4913 type:complete len:187 (+) Transcript_4343:161-721(+)|eukprot:CAMPEP_0170851206 /NCGR_PEP_ID=MMETSP0734-20130129/11092_1 /TAXON_ID=186038 /ORGANISM="Fragilariopsis kerguelensis, Strain L26-C5" /LENGTH=186 /DNA_ID=CAMNT_0011221275 /DNA_START=142 /DNA_END=702 /DNA_ORIENTATION=-